MMNLSKIIENLNKDYNIYYIYNINIDTFYKNKKNFQKLMINNKIDLKNFWLELLNLYVSYQNENNFYFNDKILDFYINEENKNLLDNHKELIINFVSSIFEKIISYKSNYFYSSFKREILLEFFNKTILKYFLYCIEKNYCLIIIEIVNKINENIINLKKNKNKELLIEYISKFYLDFFNLFIANPNECENFIKFNLINFEEKILEMFLLIKNKKKINEFFQKLKIIILSNEKYLTENGLYLNLLNNII